MAKVKPFLLLLLITFSLSSFGQDDSFTKWSFKSITDLQGKELIQIDSTDNLRIYEDGKFEYNLKAKNNLFAKGVWVKTASSIVFSYVQPSDTLRTYLIITENDTAFTINEGKVLFNFHKNFPAKGQVNAYDFKSTSVSLSAMLRGVLGITVLVFIAFLFSSKRRKINWWLVLKGLVIQVIFALAILKVEWVRIAFEWVSQVFVTVLSFTDAGSDFLFGSLVDTTQSWGYIFAFKVLPTVVFFSALTSLFFYLGIIQKLVYAFAWLMKRTLKLSGAESLAAAGNVFLGQTESPLLVKPYIGKMTKSEILCLMCGGMATIAGGVLAAYIGFLGGSDPEQQLFFAEHLLAASLMSAPAAIVAAKILRPETQEFDESMRMEDINVGSSALEAIANGTTDGLKLALNVGAMLLVFTALMYMGNYILSDIIGEYTGLNDWVVRSTNGQYSGFSFQFILGYILAPLTWLMGVASEDTVLVGQLLGEKTILNEFYAYASLGELVQAGKFASPKSIVIATYILCGFANFASIGIQIGGIGSIAPSRKSDLAKLGFQALIGGTLASLFTAVIVGMLI